MFDIKHAGEYIEGTYWATKVPLTIVNDTNTDQEFRIRNHEVQEATACGSQGTRFTDGLPNNVVPANSSRPFEVEVWHNVVSDADVPDDLTLHLRVRAGLTRSTHHPAARPASAGRAVLTRTGSGQRATAELAQFHKEPAIPPV